MKFPENITTTEEFYEAVAQHLNILYPREEKWGWADVEEVADYLGAEDKALDDYTPEDVIKYIADLNKRLDRPVEYVVEFVRRYHDGFNVAINAADLLDGHAGQAVAEVLYSGLERLVEDLNIKDKS